MTTPRFMVLSDGGVYDNMAEQWPIGVGPRKRRWPSRLELLQEADTLVVVNASWTIAVGCCSPTSLSPYWGDLCHTPRATSSLRQDNNDPSD